MNDKTGMENRDWTQMAMNQGKNSMQPDPQQQLQAAPMGQGISRPQLIYLKMLVVYYHLTHYKWPRW